MSYLPHDARGVELNLLEAGDAVAVCYPRIRIRCGPNVLTVGIFNHERRNGVGL